VTLIREELLESLGRSEDAYVPRSPSVCTLKVVELISKFVVEKVALRRVFSLSSSISPVSIIPPSFSILVYHLGGEHVV
jgi:hypothetical protein